MARILRGQKVNTIVKMKGTILNGLDLPKMEDRRYGDVYEIPTTHVAPHDMGLCEIVSTAGSLQCYGSASQVLTFVSSVDFDLREFFKANDLIYVTVEGEVKGNWRGVGASDKVLDGPYRINTLTEDTITVHETLSAEIQALDATTAKGFKVLRTPSSIIPMKKEVFKSVVPKANADVKVWIDSAAKNLTGTDTPVWNTAGDPLLRPGDIITLTNDGVSQANEIDTVDSDTVITMVDDWNAGFVTDIDEAGKAVGTFTVYRPLSVYIDTTGDATGKTLKAVQATAKFNTAGSFKIEANDEFFMEVIDNSDPSNVVTHWLRGTVASVTDNQTVVFTKPLSTDSDVLALVNTTGKAVTNFGFMRIPKLHLTDFATDKKTFRSTLGNFAGFNTYGEFKLAAGDVLHITVKDENAVNWTLRGVVATITDDKDFVLATKISQDADLAELLDGSDNAVTEFAIFRNDALSTLTLTGEKLLVWTSMGWKQI